MAASRPNLKSLTCALLLAGAMLAGAPAAAQPDDDDEIEDEIDDDVEDDIDDDIQDGVEDAIEDDVQDAVEDDLQDSLEDDVQDAVEDDVSDDVEDDIEDGVEAAISDDLDDDITDDLDDDVGDDLDDDVGDDFDDDYDDDFGDDDDDGVGLDPRAGDDDDGDDDDDEDGGRDDDDDEAGRRAGDRDSDRLVEAAERRFARGVDADDNPVVEGEWLVVASTASIDRLAAEGFEIRARETLGSFGLTLARLDADDDDAPAEERRRIAAAAPDARLDYNHLYAASAPREDAGAAPGAFEGFPSAGGKGLKIGIIDSALDLEHPALRRADIGAADFVPYDLPRPADHGTAVASVIVGDDGAFRGLAAGARLSAASVFFSSPGGAETAETTALVRALDWLVAEGVDVVNLSLAGPANAVLEEAIARAVARGVAVVAAVGNDGPRAAPRYPASYDGVVGVTAVDAEKKVYRRANRGQAVDFAAPGVGVLAADAGGGYSARSGTSFAAPFVAVALAKAGADGADEDLSAIARHAEDLGAPGRDPVFGLGYLAFPKR